MVSAYRSYEYPVKEFSGLNGAKVTRISMSPNREQLMIIDDQGSIQSINLADGQIELTIPGNNAVNLESAKWLGGQKTLYGDFTE